MQVMQIHYISNSEENQIKIAELEAAESEKITGNSKRSPF